MREKNRRKRVLVAMSGGVDSSVAALLLKQQGYEVIGITLKLWDDNAAQPVGTGKTCCALDDIHDARRVCDHLGIPFYVINEKGRFVSKVIGPFVDSYLAGRTPNPCILCNHHIKFDSLHEQMKIFAADFLATGHHARIVRDASGRFHLLKGRDVHKDQSYVLFGLKTEMLSCLLMPIGEHVKEAVRQSARLARLPTGDKPESQEICFIPANDHGSFIEKKVGRSNDHHGFFVDEAGKVLGSHAGTYRYTIGQRRGLGLGLGERRYVTAIRPDKREVVLGDLRQLMAQGLEACGLHALQPFGPGSYTVKVRYQKTVFSAVVTDHEQNRCRVIFQAPQRAITPGQAVVFYRGEEVIAGGWIERAITSLNSQISNSLNAATL